MECRLASMRLGIPNSVASNWAQQLNPTVGDLNKRIANIEATNLVRHYTWTHVPHMGNTEKFQPEGVFPLLGGQMNSASSTDAHLRKMGDIV
jgi:hypothetical protein